MYLHNNIVINMHLRTIVKYVAKKIYSLVSNLITFVFKWQLIYNFLIFFFPLFT